MDVHTLAHKPVDVLICATYGLPRDDRTQAPNGGGRGSALCRGRRTNRSLADRGYGDVEGTIEFFEWLAGNADAGVGKRGFGIWMSGRLCGYIDYTPDLDDGLDPDDVALAYAVHPWARGQGVAVEAVRLICDVLRTDEIGTRAAIRVEPENSASVRVAQKAGFRYVRDFPSNRDTHPNGTPTTFSLYLLDL